MSEESKDKKDTAGTFRKKEEKVETKSSADSQIPKSVEKIIVLVLGILVVIMVLALIWKAVTLTSSSPSSSATGDQNGLVLDGVYNNDGTINTDGNVETSEGVLPGDKVMEDGTLVRESDEQSDNVEQAIAEADLAKLEAEKTAAEAEAARLRVEADAASNAVVQANRNGTWALVLYNKEKFDIDDEDSEYTEVTFDHICSNARGVTTYCDNDEDLRSTTSKERGQKSCSDSCTIGQSCLLWSGDTEDDGDGYIKTATYTCL